VLELKRQRDFIRTREFRAIQTRRDTLALIVPLLNFNETYHAHAMSAADILGRIGLSSNLYEHAFAQIDSLVSQGIAELEHGLTQTSDPVGLVPGPELTDEHGVLWFWHHCSWSVRWGLVAKIIVVAGGLLATGFALGRINFFVEVWKLWSGH
jgi:hypothetical protein